MRYVPQILIRLKPISNSNLPFSHSKASLLLGATVVVLMQIGCAGSGGSEDSSAVQSSGVNKSPYDVNLYPLNKLVCDPFEGDGGATPTSGLKAELYYLHPGQSPLHSVNDYFTQAYKSEQKLFFSQLNVPTRLFDKGFAIESGGVVQNDNEEKLVEYFALAFKSVLKLAPGDLEGNYQFAVLSDDGVKMRIRENGVLRDLISNDGDHPTRMGCSSGTVHFNRDSEYMMELDYYQGPRYHISLVLMMRPEPEDGAQDALCNRSGNSLFFDFNNNSSPQPAYLELLDRGWKPLAQENYGIPQQALFNPCTQGEIPTLSNLRILRQTGTSVTLAWESDIPATSQVIYTDLSNKQENITASDNILRTSHQITVSGLSPSIFSFKGVSISETLGRAVTDPLEISFE